MPEDAFTDEVTPVDESQPAEPEPETVNDGEVPDLTAEEVDDLSAQAEANRIAATEAAEVEETIEAAEVEVVLADDFETVEAGESVFVSVPGLDPESEYVDDSGRIEFQPGVPITVPAEVAAALSVSPAVDVVDETEPVVDAEVVA